MEITAKIYKGDTHFMFSAKGMDYTLFVRGDRIELWTFNTKLNRLGPPRFFGKDDPKLPKAVKKAVEFIEAPAIAV